MGFVITGTCTIVHRGTGGFSALYLYEYIETIYKHWRQTHYTFAATVARDKELYYFKQFLVQG